MEAHMQLEELILDRDTLDYKNWSLSNLPTLYMKENGSLLSEKLCRHLLNPQAKCNRRSKLPSSTRGNIIKAGTTSPYSLYSESLVRPENWLWSSVTPLPLSSKRSGC